MKQYTLYILLISCSGLLIAMDEEQNKKNLLSPRTQRLAHLLAGDPRIFPQEVRDEIGNIISEYDNENSDPQANLIAQFAALTSEQKNLAQEEIATFLNTAYIDQELSMKLYNSLNLALLICTQALSAMKEQPQSPRTKALGHVLCTLNHPELHAQIEQLIKNAAPQALHDDVVALFSTFNEDQKQTIYPQIIELITQKRLQLDNE